jgi:Flp pilus assembly protein TadG
MSFARGGAHGRPGEAGQNLVEFALILPALLVLLVGGFSVGRLLLQISDAAYIAQAAATSAARYGGSAAELSRQTDDNLAHSFLAGAQNLKWLVVTRDASGGVSCSGTTCRCVFGETVAVVVTYTWEVDLVLGKLHGDYKTEKSVLCWRGLDPYVDPNLR